VIFFAHIGFDAVSTATQEAKDPQRTVPVGILGSLAICTILYVTFPLVLTGMASYRAMQGDAAPVATAIARTPYRDDVIRSRLRERARLGRRRSGRGSNRPFPRARHSGDSVRASKVHEMISFPTTSQALSRSAWRLAAAKLPKTGRPAGSPLAESGAAPLALARLLSRSPHRCYKGAITALT
jgi:Amino acid permease